MLNLLKATHYKLLMSHSEISSSTSQPSSKFADYIVTTKDKQVMYTHTLYVPPILPLSLPPSLSHRV